MQGANESHAGKLVFAMAMMAILVGFGILLAWTDIRDFPASGRATSWTWFGAGWVLTTAISFGVYLPAFLKDRINPQTPRLRAKTMAAARRLGWNVAGITMVGSSLGLMGPGFGVAVGAIASGLATFILALVPLTFFTKKGRALRARQLAANQDPT